MNHYPPAGHCRHTDQRGYKRPPASRNYDIMIHGHTHSGNIYTMKNVIHVGVDAWGFWPISFDELYDIVQKQPKE
jgi:calcineurin-like phosphoesterase family protein